MDQDGNYLSEINLLLLGPPKELTLWVKLKATNAELFTPRAFHAVARVDWWRIIVVGGEGEKPNSTQDEILILDVDVWS